MIKSKVGYEINALDIFASMRKINTKIIKRRVKKRNFKNLLFKIIQD
jgi:hypothetical protein